MCVFPLKIHHRQMYCNKLKSQCLKKVLSDPPGQVDFPVGQVTFPAYMYLPDGQDPGKPSADYNNILIK